MIRLIEILNHTLFLTNNLGLVLATFDDIAFLLKAHGMFGCHLVSVFESFWLLDLFFQKLWAFHANTLNASFLVPHSRAFDSLEPHFLAAICSYFFRL